MVFVYKAKYRGSEMRTGEVEAANKRVAMKELMAQQLQPISLEEKVKTKKKNTGSNENATLSNKDLIFFTEELSELLNAGLPLEPALSSMENRDEKGALQVVSGKIRSQITDGIQLNQALRSTSDKFDQLYVNLIAAGEQSGSLGAILAEHANYLKEQAKLKSKMLVAMIYPLCLILLCVGVIMLFIFYLLPQITSMLKSNKGDEMPIGLELATAFGDFMKAYWVYILSLIVVAIITVKLLFMRVETQKWWDEFKLSIPFYGKIYQYGFYVQWLKTLGSLLMNGVTQVQALKLANETVANSYYKKRLGTTLERVQDGVKLTSSMKQSDLFPPSMVDLIAVGDNTGDVTTAVTRAADYYETKLNTVMTGLMALVTPIVLVGMALVIGALSYTMMQAIYGAIDSMRR